MLPLIFLVVGVLAQQTFAEEPEAIVGGQPASPGQFPYQVSMRLNGAHFCGGSIIGPNKVLTAAHCVVDMPVSQIMIATGSTSSNTGELHRVISAVIHPNYGGKAENAWVNDVAVVTLAAPIKYNQYQQPIPLADSPPVDGATCTLSGWGLTRVNGQIPVALQFMHQVVVNRYRCALIHRMPLTDSHVCAFNTFGIGACSGDSGGPLVSNGKQIGITSWVLPCARGVPDAYTSVSYQLPFIRQNL